MIRFISFLQYLLIFSFGNNLNIFFDYSNGLDLVLSAFVGLPDVCVFFLLIFLALFFLLIFFLAEIRTVAIMWSLLRPQATGPTHSVISFLTGYDTCVTADASKVQHWRNGLSELSKTNVSNRSRSLTYIAC